MKIHTINIKNVYDNNYVNTLYKIFQIHLLDFFIHILNTIVDNNLTVNTKYITLTYFLNQ